MNKKPVVKPAKKTNDEAEIDSPSVIQRVNENQRKLQITEVFDRVKPVERFYLGLILITGMSETGIVAADGGTLPIIIMALPMLAHTLAHIVRNFFDG